MSKPSGGLIIRVLTLCALLFALTTPGSAGAAPPEVTTSENPVLIAHPHFTTKNIDLKWSLNPFQVATLAVTESGAPVINPAVSSPSGEGTVQLTVAYGKTYTAQLKDAFGQPLGAPLTITSDKPQIDLQPCAQRCIKSVDVQPHGGWAQFTIETSKTMVITVEASTTPPDGNGKWSDPNAIAASVGTVIPTNHYTPGLPNLQPNTTYHYVVRAHLQGHEQVKTGKFTTLTRRVEVDFDEVQMIEDSDGPLDGDCDCFFYFGVGDMKPIELGSRDNKLSIGSGTSVHIDAATGFNDAPSEIWLHAKGYDDDEDAFEMLNLGCTIGLGPPHDGGPWKTSGALDGCIEWAANDLLVPLSRQGPPGDPGAVDEQFTEPFTISVDGNVTFKVHGTYRVSYG
ncbi:fibronectin type III domain-containing protein [Mycolicibacterium boenickei]